MTTLRIHATDAPRLGAGHAWVELCHDDGTAETYGLWKPEPGGGPGGLLKDRERAAGMVPTATRETVLDAARIAAIRAIVSRDAARGGDAYDPLDGPAPFAAELWLIAAGEQVACRAYGAVGSVGHLHAALSGAPAPPPLHEPVPDRALGQPIVETRNAAPAGKAPTRPRVPVAESTP